MSLSHAPIPPASNEQEPATPTSSTSSLSNRDLLLLHRLQVDIDDLFRYPLPTGLRIITPFRSEPHPTRFCVHVTPPSGPLQGRRLHFDVEIPDGWPSVQPLILGGPWLRIGRRSKSPSFWVMRRAVDDRLSLQVRKYAPTKTLYQTILELHEYCGSEVRDTTNWASQQTPIIPRIKMIRGSEVAHAKAEAAERYLRTFRCSSCDYSGPGPRAVFRHKYYQGCLPLLEEGASIPQIGRHHRVHLTDLPMDLIMEICEVLNPASLMALCEAFEPLHRCLISTSTLLARNTIRCHYLRTSVYRPAILPGATPRSSPRLQLTKIPSSPTLSTKPPFDENTQPSEPKQDEVRIALPRRAILGVTADWTYYSSTHHYHLSSDNSLLSYDAFKEFDVRQNVTGKNIDFFLALPFGVTMANCNEPYESIVLQKVWKTWGTVGRRIRSVGSSDQALRKGMLIPSDLDGNGPMANVDPEFQTDKTIDTFTMLMSSSLSAFFQSCDRNAPSSPNTSFATSDVIRHYWQLHASLVLLARHTPGIISLAQDRLDAFIHDIGNARSARSTPDLHELLALVTVLVHLQHRGNVGRSAKSWNTLSGPFLVDFFTRHVHDLLLQEPSLEIREDWEDMDHSSADFRLSRTFLLSWKALGVLMFQVQFMKAVVENAPLDRWLRGIGPGYGFIDFPPINLASRMKRQVDDIFVVRSWPAFLTKIDMPNACDKRSFTELLKTSITLSARRRYHRSVGTQPRDHRERTEAGVSRLSGRTTILSINALRSQRWWVEREWLMVRDGASERNGVREIWGSWDAVEQHHSLIERFSGSAQDEMAWWTISEAAMWLTSIRLFV
ncbi:hypothetical protein FRB98_008764, partial [Tulasnella sp. 332]